MKRFITIVLLLTLLTSAFSCRRGEKKEPAAKRRVNVLTTFLPMYVFTMNVARDVPGVSVDVLIPPELAGPHGYEPSPSDMEKVARADILIANGLKLERFLGKVAAANPHLVISFAANGIETLPDNPPERMWEAGEHAVEGGEKHHRHHGPANPHVWVSPFLAAREVRNIADSLASADKAHADKYRKNAETYAARLETLGREFKASLAGAKRRRIVTIHNAFDYLARDVGIEVVAVLRLDPRAEPRARELARMAQRIRSEGVAAIFTEPQFPTRLADVLARETATPVYELDPVAMGKPTPGLYETVMRKNLDVLKKALGG